MQKVEGSSPFIRFKKPPETGGFSCARLPTGPRADGIVSL
jgi:hypothetical protein